MPDRTRLETRCAGEVGRENAGGEAVSSAIRFVDRFLLGCERMRMYRPKEPARTIHG
jgi:hypothetical protein